MAAHVVVLFVFLLLLSDSEVRLCVLRKKVVLIAGSHLLLRNSSRVSWRVNARNLDLYVRVI